MIQKFIMDDIRIIEACKMVKQHITDGNYKKKERRRRSRRGRERKKEREQ